MHEPNYRHAYHQSLVTKIFLAQKPAKVHCTFEGAMQMIRRIHHLTAGVPQIVYLVGWQFDGHDSKYPAWSSVNDQLKRPCDATGLQSLRWLMDEARTLNATVSVHINMCDAYDNSPLWDTYVKEDLLVRTRTGELAKGGVWGGEQSYWVSKTREWESGFARQRIDAILDLLGLQHQGTVHIDVFSPNPSEFHQHTMAREVESLRQILLYWRSRGVDVTKEWFHHEFAGLVPMAYHLNLDEASRLKYPPSVICGGGDEWNWRQNRTVLQPRQVGLTPEGGCLYEEAWGRSIDRDLAPGLNGFADDFALRTMPWMLLNRCRAIEHLHREDLYGVRFSGEVRTEVALPQRCLRLWQGERLLVDDGDVFLPAPWAGDLWLAYSRDGGRREVRLPQEWSRPGQIAVRDVAAGDDQWRGLAASGGTVTLEFAPHQALWVRPA